MQGHVILIELKSGVPSSLAPTGGLGPDKPTRRRRANPVKMGDRLALCQLAVVVLRGMMTQSLTDDHQVIDCALAAASSAGSTIR